MKSSLRRLCVLSTAAALLVGAPVAAAESTKPMPVGIASSKRGEIGLMHVESAIIAPRSTFSILATIDYWQMSDFFAADRDQKRLENSGGFSIALFDFWELYISGQATSHLVIDRIVDDAILAQAIGDFLIGSKFGYPVNDFMHMAVDLTALFRTDRGGIGPYFPATGFQTGLLTTFDFTTRPEPKPVRLNLNFGYMQDQAYKLLGDEETGDPIARYALGIPYDNNALTWGLSLEVPQPYINIFVEYSTEQYLDFDGSQPDYLGKRSYMQNPQRITPGVRVFPVAGMHIDVAVDLGHSMMFKGARYDILGLGLEEKIEPDWVFHFGVGYVFAPPKPELPKQGRVFGTVVDGRTQRPLADVRISFPGRQETALITGEDGAYRSYAFPSDQPLKVRFDRDSFASIETTVTLSAGQDLRRDIVLAYAEKAGELLGQITDAQGRPLPGTVQVQIDGGNAETISAEVDSGQFQAKLPPGIYTVVGQAPGHEPQTKRIRIADQRRTVVNFVLQAVQVVGTLRGTVRDADGRPVQAIVSFSVPTISPVNVQPQSGAYEAKVPPGAYVAKAFAPGYLASEKAIKIERDAVTTVDFILEEAKQTGKIIGQVVDARTKQGVYAVISFPNGEASNMPSDPDSGQFVADLPAGVLQIKAANPSYKASTLNVTIEKGKDTRVTFELMPYDKVRVTKEKVEISDTIEFTIGKSTIKVDSYPVLDEIAQVLKESPSMKLRIEGHTDNVGDDRVNKRLSQQRAEAVRDYIISRGIGADRLEAVGFGEERPIADNRSEDGRAKNRRVEFNITAQ